MPGKAQKTTTVKLTKSGGGLVFTSAGALAGGQEVKLPAGEAQRLIGKGHAIKITKRRKKSGAAKDADSSDAGGNSDTGGKQDAPPTHDAQAAQVHGAGAEHTGPASHSDTVNDS